MAKKELEAKVHQLSKQVPKAEITLSVDYPSTPSTTTGEGWQVEDLSATFSVAYWQGYIDLEGWSVQDLTTFISNVDVQKSYLTRNAGAPLTCPVVKELDIVSTRKLTVGEITQLGSTVGYLGSSMDLMEVIFGLRRTLVENTAITSEYQIADVQGWGSNRPTAMSKLHWTRIIECTKVLPTDIIVYPTNLIVMAVTAEEGTSVYLERLRRSYVLQEPA